ncbi:unnamed protein product [Prorocentrum cordatum]|uniref:Cellulase n=1 Tax=Prorocentrum cordatum TaxID=2364126 RepID=A0ABN9Q7Q2_9DINO|nr:unnamed protein product [Polarella glacialis]
MPTGLWSLRGLQRHDRLGPELGYVQGGSTCNQAPGSTVVGETRKWRERGSCDCMTEWNYDGDADGVMESCEGCNTRKWRECGSCNCVTEWNYVGDADGAMESHEGCSATADWDQSWRYVQGASKCNQYLSPTVVGETRKWCECGSGNCRTEWNYDGVAAGVMKSYVGCSATADGDQGWCYVQGGSKCKQYLSPTVVGETEWNCDGVAAGVMESYEGCSAAADWDQSWCYVQGCSNCNQALDSSVVGKTRKWRECGSRNCMTEWNCDGDADGVLESYEGCSAAADLDQSWCYAQGISNWNQALGSTVVDETRMLGPRQSVSPGPPTPLLPPVFT